MRTLDELDNIAQRVVDISSEIIRTSRPSEVTEKSDRDVFTDVDLTIERKIRSYLATITPEIGFVGEEEGCSKQSSGEEFSWVFDPIDGTANFAHGIPLVATSLALMRNNSPILGVIGLAFSGMCYSAIRGNGAYLNGNKISTSKKSELKNALVSIGDYATGSNAHVKNARRIELTTALAERVERVRMFGSAAHDLAWVADGRSDATMILANKPWDVAAGVLIAREAGALAVDSSGEQHGQFSADTIVATPGLLTELLKLVPVAIKDS
jgi:myo-inositol-1(or 4)-monophosphatase